MIKILLFSQIITSIFSELELDGIIKEFIFVFLGVNFFSHLAN